MNNIVLDNKFKKSINFFDDILFLDSFLDNKKVYNIIVDYLKRDNYYILKLNIQDNNVEIVNTECVLANKLNGGMFLKYIINMVTEKYKNDLIIDVKELDQNNNCIKFGRRTYNSKN